MSEFAADEIPDPTESTSDEIDFERVNRVSSRTRPISIRLVRCASELARSPSEVDLDWKERAFIGFQTSCEGWSDEKAHFSVNLGFIAALIEGYDTRTTDEPPDFDIPPDFFLEAGFVVDYEADDRAEIKEEDLQHFANANATFHTWPYWRELAQSVTTRMDIPPLVIGPFRLAP